MKNRITHALQDWNPEALLGASRPAGSPEPRGSYPLPRGINMLMPAELCISRELLVTLLSASIHEMSDHQRADPSPISDQARAEVEAALQQQLSFRAWAREHPSSYINIALYPSADTDVIEDIEDPEGF